MKESEQDNRKSPYPPANISAKYYTDPIYSTDAFYGYEPDEDPDAALENISDNDKTEQKTEAEDEPVESWGWINNSD